MPELIPATTHLHMAFLDCCAEWGSDRPHEDGFGLHPEDDVDTAEGFAAWVGRRLRLRLTHPAGAPCPDEPHASPRWIVENGVVLGGIALRHNFDNIIGQIGYGIRPSARRRGLATWALGEMLVEARAVLSWDPILIPCLDDNIASARTIERNGGILREFVDSEHGPLCRYYVRLNG